MDGISKLRHSQIESISKANHKTSNCKGFNRSFTNQRKGSRAISALDAKLNAIQNIIYGAKKTKKLNM